MSLCVENAHIHCSECKWFNSNRDNSGVISYCCWEPNSKTRTETPIEVTFYPATPELKNKLYDCKDFEKQKNNWLDWVFNIFN